jgi:hypothetical protein
MPTELAEKQEWIIRSRAGGELYRGEFLSLKEAVIAALAGGANLSGANLSGANLSGADLSRADLSGANLSGADLSRANLSGANLSGANLSGADLYGANLSGADLYGANLSGPTSPGPTSPGPTSTGPTSPGPTSPGPTSTGPNLSGANLSGANLYGANLYGANLSGANLSGANLSYIKADLWMILTYARNEAKGLLQALRDGKIDGSTYEGACACLVGTIANVRHCDINSIPGLAPNANRPAERWFLALKPGMTPETNDIAKITEGWIDEWISLQPDLAPPIETQVAPAAKRKAKKASGK